MVPEESRQYVYAAPRVVRDTFFHVMRTGVVSYLRGYGLSRGSLDEFLIAYFDRGTFHVRMRGVDADVRAGQFMVIDCREHHEFTALEDSHDVFLHFNGPMARAHYEYLTRRRGNVIALDDPHPAADDLRFIFEEFSAGRGVGDPARMSARIDSLLSRLISDRLYGSRADRHDSPVRNAIVYIADHLADDLSLEAVARAANVSRFHLARLFRAETGSSVHEYVIEARMERARYLLAYTREPVGVVAGLCGFSEAGNFSAAFRKATGMTPSDFRRQSSHG